MEGPRVPITSFSKEVGIVSRLQDEVFICAIVLVSSDRVMGSNWSKGAGVVCGIGEMEVLLIIVGIWRRIFRTLSVKNVNSSSHFSGVDSSWWIVGGLVIELNTEKSVLGLLLFLVMISE